MRVTVAISGASTASLGIKAYDLLPNTIEKHLIISKSAQQVLRSEEMREHFNNSDIGASIASGSYAVDAMMLTPCSMNTLAKIACGIADNLITRAASVMIKERKPLLLAPREMPFSAIALENMTKLSKLGVIIAPPIFGYYSDKNSMGDLESFIIGRWFDQLGIANSLYTRWK